jgi:hypothetical protein
MMKMLDDQKVDIESVDELEMYFYKCVSELLRIKRHFDGDSSEHLVGFIFVRKSWMTRICKKCTLRDWRLWRNLWERQKNTCQCLQI